MKYLTKSCLAALVLTIVIAGASRTRVNADEHGMSATEQVDATKPLQRGISVALPVTRNASEIPEADELDALVVVLTYDGKTYLGERGMNSSDLAAQVKDAISRRTDKTLYIKADARIPYAEVVKVVDSVRTSGVVTLGLLTSQRDSEAPGTLTQPKGFELLMARRRSANASASGER